VRIPAAADYASLLGLFLEERRALRYSAASLEKAGSVLPRLFAHLRKKRVGDVRAVSEAHLCAYARKLERTRTSKGEPLQPASRMAALSTIRRFFAFLMARDVILRDPARELALPRAKGLPRGVLSQAQARRLMAAPFPATVIGKRDRALLETLYGTGIRRAEAMRADLTDLDLQGGTLLVRNGKGGKDRVVPVSGRAVVALHLYLAEGRPALAKRPETALFLSRDGERLGVVGVWEVVRKHARRLGLDLNPHALRHTCATHLLQGGADLRHVQELLGHRCLTTTALYTRVAIQDLRAVMARCHPRQRASRHRRRP